MSEHKKCEDCVNVDTSEKVLMCSVGSTRYYSDGRIKDFVKTTCEYALSDKGKCGKNKFRYRFDETKKILTQNGKSCYTCKSYKDVYRLGSCCFNSTVHLYDNRTYIWCTEAREKVKLCGEYGDLHFTGKYEVPAKKEKEKGSVYRQELEMQLWKEEMAAKENAKWEKYYQDNDGLY